MSKPKRRFFRVFLLLAAVALVVAVLGWQRYMRFAQSPIVGLQPDQSLVVAQGESFPKVFAKLQAAGVTSGHELEWRLLARQLGTDRRLQVGEYALPPGITPRRLLSDLRDGKVLRRRFTVVEGWNIRTLRAALAKVPVLRQATVDMDDAALMAALGHPGQHPEGRFLPETYAWVRGESDLDILKRAYRAMEKVLADAWKARADGLPLQTPDQALVLASIVEKETGIAEERPQIAGLFIRRLQQGMKLQTDPTVIYGLGAAYDGNIRRRDLDTDTPYNTYTRTGLPPTPIAMPGRAALQATLHPAAGDAVYFVALGDGSGRHTFSRTYAEHQAAVARYLQRERERRRAASAPAVPQAPPQ